MYIYNIIMFTLVVIYSAFTYLQLCFVSTGKETKLKKNIPNFHYSKRGDVFQ